MKRQGKGLGFVISPDGPPKEFETFTCFHCQRITNVPHKARPEDVGGFCGICARLICPQCVDKGECDPFEEKRRRMEASYHARRSYGIIDG